MKDDRGSEGGCMLLSDTAEGPLLILLLDDIEKPDEAFGLIPRFWFSNFCRWSSLAFSLIFNMASFSWL